MAHLREQDGRYHAEFYDPERHPMRKWVTLRTSDKAAAQSRLRGLEREYAAGVYDPWDDPAEQQITLKEAVSEFLAEKNHLADSTKRMYDLVLRKLADQASEHAPLDRVTPKDLETVYLASDLSDTSKRTYWRHLRVFLRWAQEEGYLKRDLLEAAREPRRVKTEKVFLMPQDVEELLAAIDVAIEAEGRSGRVFVAPRADRDQVTADYLSHVFKEFVRRAGLDERVSFHTLRHTCASWLVMRGVPLKVVQRILRHSDLSTTQVYAHLAPDAMRSHMEAAFGSNEEQEEAPKPAENEGAM